MYSFDAPTFVSARRLDTPTSIGPVGVLDEESASTVKVFPERELAWEGRRRSTFSYVEPWTAPPWTLYLLLPPSEFLATSLTFSGSSFSSGDEPIPASRDGRLFYFSLLGYAPDKHGFKVEAKFDRDSAALEHALETVEVVAGSRKWLKLRDSAVGPLRASGALVASAAALKALFGL